jgi:RNA polymerase sigma-70 factor (ECF subfamily)
MVNEAEIIAEINRGVDRYAELVERYHVGLIIHCEHLVGDRDDAEDIAQEAFVKAYLKLKEFNPAKARFSTWLYKIATNLALDHLRSRRRHVDAEDIELIAEATMPAFIEEEEKREVRTAVGKLTPPEYRRVIEKYYWKGKSYQEIADELHVPLNTVRTWIRRAKLQLKEKLS